MRLLIDARVLKRVVKIATSVEPRGQEELRRKVGDRERDRVDVQEKAVAAKTCIDEERNREREHHLERHDEEDQEERVAPRVAEVDVAEHLLEMLEREAALLRDEREEQRLEHGNDDQECEEADGREEEPERQQVFGARSHPPPP